ncbi:MAG: DoxX family protein [Candidatus Sumerlaeia bacterium]|nr:DoxX family protein [Candidatus Sumerlaeia bacterium]
MLRFLTGYPTAGAHTPRQQLALRVAAGGAMLYYHGWHKAVEGAAYALRGESWPLLVEVAQLGLPLPLASAVFATIAQGLGSAFVIVGLFTRAAALFVAATLTVAVYANLAHGEDPQLALLYLVGFALVAWQGPGSNSVDEILTLENPKDVLK